MFNCFVYPAMQMSGQIYYHLSRARQARRIRDVVLVRLEQIAPFPHDLVSKVGASTSHPLARLEDLHLSLTASLVLMSGCAQLCLHAWYAVYPCRLQG